MRFSCGLLQTNLEIQFEWVERFLISLFCLCSVWKTQQKLIKMYSEKRNVTMQRCTFVAL